MNFPKLKYDSYLVIIPVALFIVGFFIHNLFLSQFSESEFEILQSKYIYIGAVAISIILMLLFFVVMRMDFDTPINNLKIKNLLTWLVRIPILAIIFHALLFPTENIMSNHVAGYIDEAFQIKITIFFRLLAFFFLIGLIWMSFGKGWDRNKYLIESFRWTYIIIFIPVFIFLLITTSLNNNLYKIFIFILIPFFFFIGYFSGASDAQKGISTKASILKNADTNFSKIIVKYMTLIWNLIFAILIVINYTINIYPMLPQSIGGAKARNVIVYTNTDTLNVRLINESTTWFLLQKPDSTIFKIKSSSVSKVQLVK